MGLLSKPRHAYHLVRNTTRLRDWRYGRTTADLGLHPAGLSVNPRGLRFEELNVTVPHSRNALLPNIKDAIALKRQAGVSFEDAEDGIIAVTPGFKAHVLWGEELFILREILCGEVYNFGTAAENVVVWDIGMNVGLASLYFASRPNVRAVIAFEPFKPTYDAAVRNFELNPDLQSKIKMNNFGVAARSYATEADYNSRWKGGISVRGVGADRREELEVLNEAFTVERIELQPADQVLRSILADYPEHAVVAKIDCEGSEYEICRCLSDHRLLEEISLIMLEWHIQGPGELLAMLHDSGFSTYSFPLGPVTGMLYAIKQGTACPGHTGASLLSSYRGNYRASRRMINTPLVSVAMVTRNVERFLPEAIESILNQTVDDLEFVIVDFGSTDRSRSIVSSYQSKDSRIKLHEIPSCTLSEARHASCLLSTSPYLAIMDADDIALPDRLAAQLEFIEKHPEVGVFGAAIELIDHSGQVFGAQQYPTGDSEIRESLQAVWPRSFCQPTAMIRREVFVSVGGYRKPFESAEDYDLWLRIAEHCEIANLPRIVLRYRRHPYQETQRNIRQQALGHFAARASADLRRSGKPDPLNSVSEITLQLLLTLGVTEAAWQRALVTKYRGVIEEATRAGEYSAGLKLAAELFRLSDCKHVDRWELADVWLKSARIHWRRGNYLRSSIAAGRAVVVRPLLLARPLKPLFRRMRELRDMKEGA